MKVRQRKRDTVDGFKGGFEKRISSPKNLVLPSTSIMELDTVPEHLIIVGGGPYWSRIRPDVQKDLVLV